MNIGMAAFINDKQPIYEGINETDGKSVRVILKSWKPDIRLGDGEIYPYVIPSSYKDAPPHKGYFDYKDNVFIFAADDFWHTPFMNFKLSKDFKTLTIVNKISERAQGILNLVEK